MSIFKKHVWRTHYVKGYYIGIVSKNQQMAETHVADIAKAKYSKYLGEDIDYKERAFKIIEVPEKSNDYIFKLSNQSEDHAVLSMSMFDEVVGFNNFKLMAEVDGTFEELLDKYEVYKAFNGVWGCSDKIGYTPERLRVTYELWILNKNLSIQTIIRNNKDLLMEADKAYFNL